VQVEDFEHYHLLPSIGQFDKARGRSFVNSYNNQKNNVLFDYKFTLPAAADHGLSESDSAAGDKFEYPSTASNGSIGCLGDELSF
jgi:hypothetical protein